MPLPTYRTTSDRATDGRELQSLPSELHWFCPAWTAADGHVHDEPPEKQSHPLALDVRVRKTQAVEGLTLYAYDDATVYQEQYARVLTQQLSRCDECIEEYYKAKHAFLGRLRNDYGEEEVQEVERNLDDHDFDRIKHALDNATRILQDLPVAQRHQKNLTQSCQMGLFEALCNDAFCQAHDLLDTHFNPPFTLVQTNKKLNIGRFLPAATDFLFHPNHDRLHWALHTWSRYSGGLRKSDWDFAVRAPLLRAMQDVHVTVRDEGALDRFWTGVNLVLDHLDGELVTHSLRALDIDLFKLALDHLKYDAPAFRCVVEAIQKSLEIAPRDFWDAMGTVSPTVLVEQIANNAQFGAALQNKDDALLSWIKPLMASLDVAQQANVCKALAYQLMDRYQAPSYSESARAECFRSGVAALAWTVANCSKDATALSTTRRVVATDTLSVVNEHAGKIIRIPSMPDSDVMRVACVDLCFRLIKTALALECRIARADHDFLQHKDAATSANYASALWDVVVQNMDYGNVELAKATLVGITDLTGLDKFAKGRSAFNIKIGRLVHLVCQILERLADFSPSDLDLLYRSSESATALIAALFAPDANLHRAAVDLIKHVSSELARKEALGHMLRSFFEITLNGMSWAIRRIEANRTYGSCSRVLKTSADVIDVLCDAQDGLLRGSKRLTEGESKALEYFWQYQWQCLRLIYETTEEWGRNKIDDPHTLKELCRDTMQHSAKLFDQYSVFASTLGNAELLQHPAQTLLAMSKWLRLRDLYLVDIAVNLTIKVLGKLSEVQMRMDDSVCKFLEQVIHNGPQGRTHLTPGEKAELARAVEANIGVRLEPKTVSVKRPEVKEDLELVSRSSAMMNQIKSRPTAGQIDPTKSRPPADQASFREKREKEKEAKKKRDMENIAMLKRRAAGVPADGGSGLQGLGVQGKDHAPQGPSMMLSSASESDSEDSDLDASLFGKQRPVSAAVREYQASRPQRVPVKKTRQVRSVKDMRARLAPDLTSLHKTILSWDFFHQGDFPPGTQRNDYSFVSSTFRTPLEYEQTFEPLLILEAWQGMQQSKEEGNLKTFEIKIASRMNVDAFLEISTTMPMSEGRDLGIGEADIMILSQSSKQEPHCLSRISKVTRKKGAMEVTLRMTVNNALVGALVPNGTISCAKITSITPLEREYGALSGLKYFDLCDEITRAQPSPLLEYSERHLRPLAQLYRVNEAQAKAIRSALDNDAFTLIQGPPGSGKTKTIVAIVGALLSDNFADRGQSIKNPAGAAQKTSKKLLVCAPSNAAVDELVLRFKDGIRGMDGRDHQPSIVRLGRSDAINANVMDVTLEELVNAKIGQKTTGGDETGKIMQAHKSTCEKFNSLKQLVGTKGATTEQNHELEVLKRQKQQLSTQIDQARDSGAVMARDAEFNRRRVQQEILDGSHIICATLSGSGHEMFQNLNIEFETVVIDEAAQSIELSALIPLKYGCSKCILVGDPKQLPPTVLSREAARFQYEQSLFVRMQTNHPRDVHLLDTQYRMHPAISAFPSSTFYDGRLLDGPDMAQQRKRPWHKNVLLGPYRFFDVKGAHQSAPRGHSLINIAEIEVALRLYAQLLTDCKEFAFEGKVGIITPYKSQLRELRSRFAQKYGDGILKAIEFNTTDAFQGRESEIIIFSCVRASPSKGIGFLSDIRRMNVGITRAKSSLWVLGNSQSLIQGEYWGRLIEDAKQRNLYGGADLLLQFLSLDSTKPEPMDSRRTNGGPNVGGQHLQTREKPVLAPGQTRHDKANESTPSSRLNATPELVYRPSGGGNGLNSSRTCAVCGSYAHHERFCDNEEALEAARGRCFRCQEVGHKASHCTAERCIDCGETGHNQTKCTSSTILSSKDRTRIGRQEIAHKAARDRLPELQRKRHLGDHDPKIPEVRATETTPPPIEEKKRKRESPTPKALESRKVSNGHTAPVQNGNSHDPGLGSTHAKSSGDIARDGSSASRQPLPPQNQVRPKKKRPADPFIRPKKR